MSSSLSCKNVPVYEDVNRLIFEYLEVNGLEDTLGMFVGECVRKSLPCPALTSSVDEPSSKVAFTVRDAQAMMTAFDIGDLHGFFKWWGMFLSHIEVTSEEMLKLEVYIRVHFALWPLSSSTELGQQEDQHRSMGLLKSYFEENSGALAGDTSILPLFALPFVSDPKGHPLFKELFQESWKGRLRGQLETTVNKYFDLLQKNICTHSRLAELVVKHGDPNRQTAGGSCSGVDASSCCYHQERFLKLLESHRRIRKTLATQREEHNKMQLVTRELFVSLEKLAGNTSLQFKEIVGRCAAVYPEVFNVQADGENKTGGSPDVEYFKEVGLSVGGGAGGGDESEVSLFFLGMCDVSPETLDYAKVKETLGGVVDSKKTSSPSAKLCLLQSLRWMVTKTDEVSRGVAVGAFVRHDLLGLRTTKPDYRMRLFKCLLSPTPTYHKECFARLLNGLSSVRSGREYLSSCSLFVVDALVECLSTFRSDRNESFICQMVVACLQKLSLKKNMRLAMIKHRVINWLVTYIKGELAKVSSSGSSRVITGGGGEMGTSFQFNPYLMEYGWALLMNLCLHEEAWESCRAAGADILTSAANMLVAIPRKDLAPYVISTLYSVLRSPEMFALAKEIELDQSFGALLKGETTDVGQHLNHLVELLWAPGADRITSSRETNYDDDENPDPEVLEPELELPESWTSALGEGDLTGDELLLRVYLKKAPPQVQQQSKTSSGNRVGLVGESTTTTQVMVRPVTPSSLPTVVGDGQVSSKKKSAGGSGKKVLSSSSRSTTTTPTPRGSGGSVKGSSNKKTEGGSNNKAPSKKKKVKGSTVSSVGGEQQGSSELSVSKGAVISIFGGSGQ